MQHHALNADELGPVLDSLTEGLQVVDREFRYVYLNRAALTHGRADANDLLGRTMMECYPGIENTAVFRLIERAIRENVPSQLQNEFTYPDGKTATFDLRIAPSRVGATILSIDVTESRRTEEQLRHAQKMDAVGRLAGSVAHDFNNLLSVVLSHSAFLLEDLHPTDAIRSDVEAIQRAGERAADLSRQLLTFSRQELPTARVIDLNEALASSESMLTRLLGADVELVARHDSHPLPLRIDPGRIDQVVMNLALNARDAMPRGGKLTIETKEVVLDERYALDHLGVTPGPYVLLAVSDTGVGMTREVQDRIFEPFFTTKEVGRGTGLGLSTVFGIVKQHGGSVWVYSEVDNGTTFKVYLPRAEGETSEIEMALEPTRLEGDETILVVDDQDEVRTVARQILRRFGYHVLEANDAKTALALAAAHAAPIQLLVTDVVMPQIFGPELLGELRKMRPELKVLFMSGYTHNAVLHRGLVDDSVAYIPKPLVPDALARQVRTVLDSGSASEAATSSDARPLDEEKSARVSVA